MAGQVCFAHQIGHKGQEKLHNERHKWKLGGGGARITDVVLQSGWACSAVVQSATPRTPSSFHPISDGYHSVVCSRVQDENVQRL